MTLPAADATGQFAIALPDPVSGEPSPPPLRLVPGHSHSGDGPLVLDHSHFGGTGETVPAGEWIDDAGRLVDGPNPDDIAAVTNAGRAPSRVADATPAPVPAWDGFNVTRQDVASGTLWGLVPSHRWTRNPLWSLAFIAPGYAFFGSVPFWLAVPNGLLFALVGFWSIASALLFLANCLSAVEWIDQPILTNSQNTPPLSQGGQPS